MREKGGRQGEAQRGHPDDQQANKDQFGFGAADERLDGSHNGRVPVEAERREREDRDAD